MCVLCSRSVWTSRITSSNPANIGPRPVSDLNNYPRSSLCSVVVLTHVLLKLIQPRQEPEQAGRGPTCQLLQPPPVVFLNPNDRFGSFDQQEDSRNTTDDARSVVLLPLEAVVRQCPEATHAWPAVLSWNSPPSQPSAST